MELTVKGNMSIYMRMHEGTCNGRVLSLHAISLDEKKKLVGAN